MIATPDPVAGLADLKMEALRSLWRDRFGDPPPLRSTDLMRRALAERLQQAAYGGDLDLDRRLARAAARHRSGRRPVVRLVAFKPGSRRQREWQGEHHQIEVVEGGYVWNGRTCKSLSQVARLITGVRWNGPRFFGLREGAAR